MATSFGEVTGGEASSSEDLVVVVAGDVGDMIPGTAGDDALNGTPGDDTIMGEGGNDVIVGEAGDDSLVGGAGGDILDGGAGNDTIVADDDDLIIDGGADDDLVSGLNDPAGSIADGGLGNDTIAFDANTTGIDVNLLTEFGSFENVIGGTGNDTIVGDENSNLLEGSGGGDSLEGGDGDDTLNGGEGDDTLDGGAGNNEINAGEGEDTILFADGLTDLETAVSTDGGTISVNDADGTPLLEITANPDGTISVANIVTGTVDTLTDVETLAVGDLPEIETAILLDDAIDGTDGDDSLVGTAGDDTINGLAGNDTLDGMAGADELNGGAGDDLIISDGLDTVDGGTDTDTIDLSEVGAPVVIDLDLNTPPAGAESEIGAILDAPGGNVLADVIDVENVIGTDFADFILGNNEVNVLEGGAGDDTLHSFGGADTIDGGEGSDTALFSAAPVGINVDLDENGDATLGGGEILISIENISGSGTGDDTLAGNDAANVLNGQGGNDVLSGEGGDDTFISDGIDTIDGGEGIDTVDFSSLAAGIIVDLDINTPTPGPESQEGGVLDAPPAAGGAVLFDLDDIENVIGTDFDDGLFGNNEVNVLEGGAGDDIIHSFGGADTLDGGEGTDTALFTASPGATVVLEADGNATSSFGDTLISIENLTGSAAGPDDFTGNDGANVLTGNGGDDTLNGGGGDDTLNGGDGADSLDGGEGIDTAVFAEDLEGLVTELNDDGTVAVNDADGNTVFTITDNGDGTLAIADADGVTDTLTDVELLNIGNLEDLDVATLFDDGAINGTDGDDDLEGTAGDDTINGLAGNDTLDGLEGADTLNGGMGDDTLISDALDTVDGGEGIDTIDLSDVGAAVIIDLDVESAGALGTPSQNGGILAGPPAIDENGVESADNILQEVDDVENIIGTDFDDLLIGNNESNVIQGGTGNDTLAGVAADDTLDGGEGIDTALFTFAPMPITVDLAIEGPQDIGPPGVDTLISIENVSGSDFASDTLLGNEENNVLSGLAFDDVLEGRGGDDTLNGGDGADTLDGGEGLDTAVFAEGVEGLAIAANDDGTFGINDADGNTVFTIADNGDGTFSVTDTDGVTDSLTGIEFLDIGNLVGLSLEDLFDDAIDGGTAIFTDPVVADLSLDSILTGIDFIGEVAFPTGATFTDDTLGELEIGGLSGLEFNPATGSFFALSDDQTQPQRFFTLDLVVEDGAFVGVEFTDAVQILDSDGEPFTDFAVDLESIRLSPDGTSLFIASETGAGPEDIDDDIPFVVEIDFEGNQIGPVFTFEGFAFDEGADPDSDADNTGVRNNNAFESLSFSADGASLFVATEAALFQDGPAASLEDSSPSRVVQFDPETGDVLAQFVYVVDPIPVAPEPVDSFADNGLVEILTLSDTELLFVERSFAVGVGNTIRVFLGDTTDATDVSELAALEGEDFTPIEKTLLFDTASFGIDPDNIEGITFGPTLEDGSQSFFLVSDNNFNPNGQFTQFLGFTLDGTITTFADDVTVEAFEEGTENLLGSAFDDFLTGDENDNAIAGNLGDDFLRGFAGVDTLDGGPGNDTIVSDGLDAIDGGEGIDTVSFADAAVGVSVSLEGGFAPAITVLNDGSEDLSGSADAPTVLELEVGTSQISNQVANAAAAADFPPQDVDIFTIVVPEGAVLSELVLSEFISEDDVGFLAVVEGETFPADALAGGADTSTFIGLANFGDGGVEDAQTGTNILPALAAGGGLVGPDDFMPFDAEVGLEAGTFTFLVQQLGPFTADYTFDFVVESLDGVGDAPSLVDVENLIGSAGDDTLVGDDGDNVIDGGAGSDVLEGGAGDDTFISDGTDTIDGGEGTDTVDFSGIGEDPDAGPVGIIVDLDINTPTPGPESQDGGVLDAPPAAGGAVLFDLVDIENVTGTAFDDGLFGNNEVNILEGGAGDDIIHSFGGADTLDGGEGTDTALFTASPGATVVLDADGNATSSFGDTLISIENLTGSVAGPDDFTGNDGANVLTGNGGDDTLNGGGGDDTLNGGDGADSLDGGEGIDTAVFAEDLAGLATVFNDDGTVTIDDDNAFPLFTITDNGDGSISIADIAAGTTDTLTSVEFLNIGDLVGLEVATLFDGPIGDIIGDGELAVGTPLDDVIQGGVDITAISNIVLTGAGSDAVDLPFDAPDATSNIVLTGSDSDSVIASQDDIISGGTGDDTFSTANSEGGNRISGGAGNDTFSIAGSGDRLLGGAGDDTFEVGTGSNNILSGGEGADTFVLFGEGEVLESANFITDFDAAADILSAPGVAFEDLSFSGSDILVDGNVVATLLNFDAETLTAENFGLEAPAPDPTPDPDPVVEPGAIASEDLASIALGEVVVGPLGPVVAGDFETAAGDGELLGNIASSAFLPATEEDPFTFVSSVTLEESGFTSLEIDDVSGFTGVAGFLFADDTGLPEVDGLNFGSSLGAWGNGNGGDFDVEFTEEGSLIFTPGDEVDEEFFITGDTVTFFYQSEFGPVGPENTAFLTVGTAFATASAPLPGPDSAAAQALDSLA